jgi:protein-S-isoprenylcysteine O-methyltransferase Ste14
MIDPNSDRAPDMPKASGGALAWLGYAIGLLGLLLFGFCAVLLPIMGLQATDTVERETMFAFALIFALPAALVCGLLTWWTKRIINRRSKLTPS